MKERMNMKESRKILKIFLDIILFILTFCLIEIDLTGNIIHEYLGILITILIVLHIILNYNWFIRVIKNYKKVNTKAKIIVITDLLILISFLMTIICGILISNEIFNFKLGSNIYIIITHVLFGRLSLIIMLFHVFLHLNMIFKSKKVRKVVSIIFIIISFLISIYFIYGLLTSFQWISFINKIT